MNYYERHIGDYLKDTAHLSLLEHGVYGRLLDVYYTRESAIPDAQAARLIGARTKDELAAMRAVLHEFFIKDEDGAHWIHSRCEREIARYQDKQRKASASANARWKKCATHSGCNANESADAMRTHSEGNAPSNQTPDTSNTPPPPPRAREPSIEVMPMEPGWQPSPQFAVLAKLSGLPPTPSAEGVGEFKAYWLTQPTTMRTALEWDNALVKSLKHEQVRGAATPRQTPRRTGAHAGFESKDYTAGVNKDGTLA